MQEKAKWQLRLGKDGRSIQRGRCGATLGFRLTLRGEPDKIMWMRLMPGYADASPGDLDPDKWGPHYEPTKDAKERYRRDRKQASHTDPLDPKRWDRERAKDRRLARRCRSRVTMRRARTMGMATYCARRSISYRSSPNRTISGSAVLSADS
jgi:hypothetical protein